MSYFPLLEGNKMKFASFLKHSFETFELSISKKKITPKILRIYYEPYIVQGVCFFPGSIYLFHVHYIIYYYYIVM